MKEIIKLLIPLIIIAPFHFSCKKLNEDIPITYPVDVEVSDFSLTGTPCNWNWQTIKRDTLYVINSVEDIRVHVSCQVDNLPSINFGEKSLLLIRGVTPNGVYTLSRFLKQNSSKEYLLEINIKMNATTLPGHWLIAILTPKLSSSAIIELDIKQHY